MEELKAMHSEETKNLNEQLLKGADWAAVKDQRKFISDISKVIVRKESGIHQDPSGTGLRESK